MITEKDFGRGFQTGMYQVRLIDKDTIIESIKEILGVKTRVSFNLYKKGEQEMSVNEAKQVDELFASYGIKKCWGIAKPSR